VGLPAPRSAVESTVERALETLGQPVEAEVFLIGFALEGRAAMPICIEPERGPLAPADFAGTRARAEAIFDADPDRHMRHSDARLHQQRQEALRDRAWRRAIAEILESKLAGRFYVAASAPVANHRVYSAVGLERAVVDAFPALTTTTSGDGRITLSSSLLEAAMDEILRHVTRALYEPDPGTRLGPLVEPGELTRAAGESLAVDVAYRADSNLPAHGFFAAMNQLATATYEKRPGLGRLILASPTSEDLRVALLLKQPAPMNETRTMRKLLETSRTDGAALLTDGSVAYGLGDAKATYHAAGESLFEVVVSGPGTWDLRHVEQPLMRVVFGSPRLAETRLSRVSFDDVARRVLGPAGHYDSDRLWALAMAAKDAEHGTMLVVSSQATAEAARLQSQALVVQPTMLETSLVAQLKSIDGALLVDPTGVVEAVGVILDGRATAEGDRSRGARYNSALRYLASVPPKTTMIVLVSEDGILDLLPRLRLQIRRSEIEAMLNDLRTAAAIEPVDAEQFYRVFNRLKAAAFYLSGPQCVETNRLVEEHWTRRRAAGATLWMTERPLEPHPEMSDEYLMD
jgi:hypothetical protein